jgi:hypothetical protein
MSKHSNHRAIERASLSLGDPSTENGRGGVGDAGLLHLIECARMIQAMPKPPAGRIHTYVFRDGKPVLTGDKPDLEGQRQALLKRIADVERATGRGA